VRTQQYLSRLTSSRCASLIRTYSVLSHTLFYHYVISQYSLQSVHIFNFIYRKWLTLSSTLPDNSWKPCRSPPYVDKYLPCYSMLLHSFQYSCLLFFVLCIDFVNTGLELHRNSFYLVVSVQFCEECLHIELCYFHLVLVRVTVWLD
jgi:hypothetical protein